MLEFSPNQGDDEHLDIVMLSYNHTASRLKNPEMPKANINFYKYDYEKGLDHMEFTPEELQRFPEGSIVNIKMVRFIRNNFYVEGKRIEVDRTISQLTFAIPVVE